MWPIANSCTYSTSHFSKDPRLLVYFFIQHLYRLQSNLLAHHIGRSPSDTRVIRTGVSNTRPSSPPMLHIFFHFIISTYAKTCQWCTLWQWLICCHQCVNTYLIPMYMTLYGITTLNEDSVVTSQVSPPGCHPAVCNKRNATTSAIGAMKAETCNDTSSEAPLRPVTISAGKTHTVRINHYDNNNLFQPPSFMYCFSHDMAHALLLWMADSKSFRCQINSWSPFSIADGGDSVRGTCGLG